MECELHGTLPRRFISHITAVHGPKRVFDFLSHPVDMRGKGDVRESLMLTSCLDVAARTHLKGAPPSFESVIASFMDTCRDADRVLEFAEVLGAMLTKGGEKEDVKQTATKGTENKNSSGDDVDSLIGQKDKPTKDKPNLDGDTFGKKKKNKEDHISSLTVYDCIKWIMLFLVWISCQSCAVVCKQTFA